MARRRAANGATRLYDSYFIRPWGALATLFPIASASRFTVTQPRRCTQVAFDGSVCVEPFRDGHDNLACLLGAWLPSSTGPPGCRVADA
jgi:hypothetical protein